MLRTYLVQTTDGVFIVKAENELEARSDGWLACDNPEENRVISVVEIETLGKITKV